MADNWRNNQNKSTKENKQGSNNTTSIINDLGVIVSIIGGAITLVLGCNNIPTEITGVVLVLTAFVTFLCIILSIKHPTISLFVAVAYWLASMLFAAVTFLLNFQSEQTPSSMHGENIELPSVTVTDTCEIDSKTQYRSRVRETTTSSEPSLQGWLLFNTISAWGEYGPWSEWSTTPVGSSDTVMTEAKTQYRYRDQISSTTTTYGEWSDWQDNAISPSDTIEVETRQVDDYVETTYSYGAYFSDNSEKPATWSYFCGVCARNEYGGAWEYRKITQAVRAEVLPLEKRCDHCGNVEFQYLANDGLYYYDESILGTVTYSKFEYRYRDINTTTEYNWTEWSQWSDTAYSASETREVDNRSMYRYCVRSIQYTYEYERFGEWGPWVDDEITETDNLDVESRVVSG